MPDPSRSGTATERLATLLARPIAVADRARAARHLLDWIGCAAIGAVSEAGRLIRTEAEGCAGAAPLLGGGNADPATACYVHGGLGGILEMDDVHRTAILHPGPVVIPAVLAAAAGSQVRDGIAVLDAIVRGYEAMIRLGRSVGPGHYAHFHNTGTCGAFGAAAGVASLLGLGPAELVQALGNAATVGAGLWQCRHEPVMTKSLHAAHAARAGLSAARLAARGFTGPAGILDGVQGFFAGLCPDGRIAEVTTGPDDPWLVHAVSFKPWPACRHAHAAIDAALEVRERLDDASVARITIETYRDAALFCDRPLPTTVNEAKFSLQHAVAVALIDGPPKLDDFAIPALSRADVAALRAKATVEVSPAYSDVYPAHFGSAVRVWTSDGRQLEARIADALGDTERPVDDAILTAKARLLMGAAGWPAGQQTRVVDAVLAMPDSADFAALQATLSHPFEPPQGHQPR